MTVLLVSHTEDNESVELVAAAIAARGGRAVRVDTDRFPTELQLSIAPGDPLAPGLLRAPEMEVNLADVSAVWYR
ncbi:MAG: MvdD family ATP-grasp ribosomal peptide maturase, partial [Pseudomonadota bacterium]|nr:MvdD family ATP-grasp ribosomal peptide maturase [Pseudomonadota bacterium]